MLPASYGSPLLVLPVLPEIGSSLGSGVPKTAFDAACAMLLMVSMVGVVLRELWDRVCWIVYTVVVGAWVWKSGLYDDENEAQVETG